MSSLLGFGGALFGKGRGIWPRNCVKIRVFKVVLVKKCMLVSWLFSKLFLWPALGRVKYGQDPARELICSVDCDAPC